MTNPLKIAFANDHAGFPQREPLIALLRQMGHEIQDYGSASPDAVDYADYSGPACEAVRDGRADRAILVCGSGIGMSIAANRFPGIRCALVTDEFAARSSRSHNNANVLALRAREQSAALNDAIVKVWLETPFEGGRHQRRIEKIESVSRDAVCGPQSQSEVEK